MFLRTLKQNHTIMNNYHLSKDGDDWKLKKEHAERSTAVFADLTKAEAVREAAKLLADSGSSLKIHKVNGTIEEERTYPRSADPKRSKG